MSQIGLNVFITGLTGKLIIRWVRASAPLAEVGRSAAFNFPYDNVYDIPDLAPVVYIVQFWRSNDGVSLDQLIKDWAIDASKTNRTTVNTYQYKVGRGWDNTTATPEYPTGTGIQVWHDPEDGDSNLEDERLDGFDKKQLTVHEAGYGDHLYSEYELLPGGGISLPDGVVFNEDTAWFITTVESDIIEIGDVGGSGGIGIAKIVALTADRDFYVDDADNLYNALCVCAFPGTNGKVIFGAFATIPDGTHVIFQTHSGSQNYLRLQFNPGDTVNFQNQDVNVIDLARCEKIHLYFFDGACYVIDYDGNVQRRGTIQMEYDETRGDDLKNLLYAHESTGELNKADFEGLYAFIAQLVGNAVCPLGTGIGQWSYNLAGVYPNKSKFGIDTVALKFRVPHLVGLSIKASTVAGVYEGDNVGNFSNLTGALTVPKGWGYQGGPNNNTHWGNGNPSHADNEVMPFSYVGNVQETRVKSISQKPFIVL